MLRDNGRFINGSHRDRWRPDVAGDKRGELTGEESGVTSLRW